MTIEQIKAEMKKYDFTIEMENALRVIELCKAVETLKHDHHKISDDDYARAVKMYDYMWYDILLISHADIDQIINE